MKDKIQKTVRALTVTGGAAGSAAAAPIAAEAAGVTVIPVVTKVAGWFGLTVLHATPIGWFVTLAAVGASVAYGLSKLIENGAEANAEREIHERSRTETAEVQECSRRAVQVSREALIELKKLVEKAVAIGRLTADQAQRFVEEVKLGSLSVEDARRVLATEPGLARRASGIRDIVR